MGTPRADERDVSTIDRIGHDEAMALTAVENEKFAELLGRLTPDEWRTATECERWDVRAMVAHVVGSAAGQVSPREFIRQARKGRPIVEEIGAAEWYDGMNEFQVRERADMSTEDLIAEWDEKSVKALRARTKLPRLIAKLPVLNLPAPVGRQPVSYLMDMGFTRDVWMHRVDIAHSLGQPPNHDESHDGRILEDVVAEWASLHGEPFRMELEGPAGGTFVSGEGGEPIAIGVVEFLRILTERADGPGVLQHRLPL